MDDIRSGKAQQPTGGGATSSATSRLCGHGRAAHQAADLFEQGVTPAEIARRPGLWHQIVPDWRAAWRRSGRDGLCAAGRAGRLPTVTREQLDQVETELAKGAEANGYPNDVWTCNASPRLWAVRTPDRPRSLIRLGGNSETRRQERSD